MSEAALLRAFAFLEDASAVELVEVCEVPRLRFAKLGVVEACGKPKPYLHTGGTCE